MVVVKAFFRYLRGELLNGFFIRKLNLVTEKLLSLSKVKTELLYWMNFQFGIPSEEYPMRHSDLKGIAQVAGILSIRGASSFLVGWFRLSESHLVGTKQRSERALLEQDTGTTVYRRTDADNYPTDISTIATEEERMSLIPNDAVPIGYVWGDNAAVILDTGMVDGSLLEATPPIGYNLDLITNKWIWEGVGDAPVYAPWYGNKFLPLSASYPMTVALPDDMLEFLFKMHQKIKYNGTGIVYLLEATDEMVPDLITDLKLEILNGFSGTGYDSWYYKMTYTKIEENFAINNGWSRFAAWAYFVQSKYPFIKFNETGD